VSLFVDDTDFRLYVGDVRDCLRELPPESVHCVVTSPPYWGLRDYGTGSWVGGDPDCEHKVRENPCNAKSGLGGGTKTNGHAAEGFKNECPRCGATRVDQQIGLEATPEAFVQSMVDVFREVRRVLRADGTCWVNLGDSYSGGGGYAPDAPVNVARREAGSGMDGAFRFSPRVQDRQSVKPKVTTGLKQKDLVGIPWRVAFALQADGWYLRSDIVWSKPNPMPESVTDRPTKAHEYVFLLTRSPRYFFDQEAVREPHTPDGRKKLVHDHAVNGSHENYANMGTEQERWPNGGRNIRSVWEIATQPYPEAHFATFPEALPERCIKAGTSERGCCPECGAPWEREVEKELVATRGNAPPDTRRDPYDASSKEGGWGDYLTVYGRYNVTTTGWRPSCKCWVTDETGASHVSIPQPVPCTVLDPFMGSGTTALVARRLGRKSVGVELNPEYAALCARRLQQLSLLA
jgi:DNA modification methylase